MNSKLTLSCLECSPGLHLQLYILWEVLLYVYHGLKGLNFVTEARVAVEHDSIPVL